MAITGIRVIGDRYVLVDVLGTGGMSTVWRARDEVLGREVAVKVLSPQYATDAAFRARFEREARHVAGLSHPRLVTVFDCGVQGTTPFIVMELVAGRTLRQILDETTTIPPGDAVTIAAAVCEGLAAAHAAGLVHRDIKPANIVLSGPEVSGPDFRTGQPANRVLSGPEVSGPDFRTGQRATRGLSAAGVKVLDFGIARLDGTAGGTRTHTVLGTAAYLSPEQASGRPVGPQADLYALGCVLFEMLTGTPPFTADSDIGVAYRQVHDDPAPPSARRPGLPAELDWITTRLLAKNPADRPPGAAAARTELLAALTPGRTAAFPAQVTVAAQQPQRRLRRPRSTELILGVALLASLAGLLTVLLTSTRSTPPPAPVTVSHSHGPRHSPSPSLSRAAAGHHRAKLPPVAAAAATFVGDLQAGVGSGQVSTDAGRNLFNQLQQLLFEPPGQNPQHVQQQYDQLVQAYAHYQAGGQITGHAAVLLSRALDALRAATGVR